jgi:hypothetical protein
MPSDSAISAAFARRDSLRIWPPSLASSTDMRFSAFCKSPGSIWRFSFRLCLAAISSASRIMARSARLSAASSFGSPPVIIMRAEISISPGMSRFSLPSPSSSPLSSSIFSGRSLSFTAGAGASTSNSLCASANGGSDTPLPGLTLTLFTVRPRLSK